MQVYRQRPHHVLAEQFTVASRPKITFDLCKHIVTIPHDSELLVLYDEHKGTAYPLHIDDWVVDDEGKLSVMSNKEFVKKYDVVPYPRTEEEVK